MLGFEGGCYRHGPLKSCEPVIMCVSSGAWLPEFSGGWQQSKRNALDGLMAGSWAAGEQGA
jgi:hypothetical protein